MRGMCSAKERGHVRKGGEKTALEATGRGELFVNPTERYRHNSIEADERL